MSGQGLLTVCYDQQEHDLHCQLENTKYKIMLNCTNKFLSHLYHLKTMFLLKTNT